MTDNISRSGILVEIAKNGAVAVLPRVGECLTVDVELKPNSLYGGKCLRCSGAVVRVFHDTRCLPLVAVSVAQMEFITARGQLELMSREGGRMVNGK